MGEGDMENPPPPGPAGRFVGRVSYVLAVGAAVVLALMMYITFIDVTGRFVLNRPITGSVEIILLMMGLLVFLGIGLTTFEEGHIRVDVLTRIMPPRLQALVNIVVHALSLTIAALMCWQLWVVALDQTRELNETQVLGLPVWIVALVMAACSFTMVAGLLLHLHRAGLSLFGENNSRRRPGP